MTIGEALKNERIKLGLSKYQFAKGIIDPKFYGKVEEENRNIGSKALIKLILLHRINVDEFFDEIKDNYASKEDLELEFLDNEMKVAVLHKDLQKIQDISDRYFSIAPNSIDYLRSRVFLTYLRHDTPESGLIDQIQRILDRHEDLSQDVQAIRLFSNSLPILPIKQVNYFMKIILNRFAKQDILTIDQQRRIAQLCNNYFQTCLERKINSVNIEAVDQLFNKITNPEMLIYKLLEKRDYFLLKDKENEADKLTEVLKELGYEM